MLEHALPGGLRQPLDDHVNVCTLKAKLDFVGRFVAGAFGFDGWGFSFGAFLGFGSGIIGASRSSVGRRQAGSLSYTFAGGIIGGWRYGWGELGDYVFPGIGCRSLRRAAGGRAPEQHANEQACAKRATERSADFQSAVSQGFQRGRLENSPAPEQSGALPIGNRRYSRLEICVTLLRRAADRSTPNGC